jgi:hypothetical protein
VNTLIGEGTVHPESLRQIRERGGTWAAYQNHAMDSAGLGHLQFLRYGVGCTFAAPPDSYPADTVSGAGWRYLLVGFVDLSTGQIVSTAPTTETHTS